MESHKWIFLLSEVGGAMGIVNSKIQVQEILSAKGFTVSLETIKRNVPRVKRKLIEYVLENHPDELRCLHLE